MNPSKKTNKPAKRQAPVVNKPKSIGPTVAPIAKQRVTRNAAPKFKQTKEGCTIHHREFITDIVRSSTGFVIDTININAGLASSFPWLAQVAGRFESYTFERLDYIYEPMVPTTQPGTIMMAIDFDALDSPPSGKTTLMSYQGATRSAPWQPSRLSSTAIDRKKMVNERYVRAGPLTGSFDIKTYDVGNLYVGTQGVGPTSVTLGELYVEYVIRLRTPQIPTAPGLALNRRTTQTGTFTWSLSSQAIINNIATIVGEGNQPLALAAVTSGLERAALYVDPRIRRFLFLYSARPQNANWSQAVSTMFSNPLTTSVPNTVLYGSPTVVGPGILRASRLAYNYPGVIGQSNSMAEQIQFSEADSQWLSASGPRFGPSGASAIPLRVRTDAVTNNTTGTIIVDYTIIPLDNEVSPTFPITWPQTTGPQGDAVVSYLVQFPTIETSLPARGVHDDGVNQISIGTTTVLEEPQGKRK